MAHDKRLENVLKLMEKEGGISSTKDTDPQLNKDIQRAKSLGYIQSKMNRRTGLPGYSYEFTEKGQRLVDSGYNFTIVEDHSSLNITGTNVHVGDNKGNYVQSDSMNSNENIIKKIIIGVIIAVIAGLILYIIIG